LLNTDLVGALVGRLKEARAKHRLEEFLKEVKGQQGVPRGKFRTSGTMEQLAEAVQIAAQEGSFNADSLAGLVDEVEENGGQHIFLFDLTDAGADLAGSRGLRDAFQPLPRKPTLAMYAELPTATRTYFSERDDIIVIKQISRASYWERDDERSERGEDERVEVTVRRHRRAINLLRIDPTRRRAEVRIDRVRGEMDNVLAIALFRQFQKALEGQFDFGSNMIPVQIWQAFTQIVADREHTYMSTDAAKDPSVSVQISTRRESDQGTDVRDHPSYKYGGSEYVRESLNVFWHLSETGDKKFHTILSRVKMDDTSYGKIYVAAKLEPAELTNVIDRIRQFTLDAS
jgi:hypothetical protein